jgi:Tol biopolymer transport system component
VRDKDIWAMDADGSNQMAVCEVKNADGRLSWSPDNRRIIFTRSGFVDLKSPDMLGGRHKVYDLFIALLDSAEAHNKFFWYRVSDDVGSRDPQWLPDDRILFWKDLNANNVNAGQPNYQICMMNPDGTNLEILRKDWKDPGERFLTQPSMSKNGGIAFVYFENMSPHGLVVLPRGRINMSTDSIRDLSVKNPASVGPAWSPDGKWLAFIKNDINNPGVYISTADLSEKYLVFEPPVGVSLYTASPSFSPNSKWLTFSTMDGSVWISDITGKEARRLTGPGTDRTPAWSNKAPTP